MSGATRSVSVVTDSGVCLPEALVAELGLVIVPIHLHIGGEEFLDDEPVARRALYAAVARGKEVKSSTPSPLEYQLAIDCASYDDVLVITTAAEFSAMTQAARLGAQLSPKNVVVLDSRSAAGGQALVSVAAAQSARAGQELGQIVADAESSVRRCRVLAAVSNFTHLAASGRVGADVLASAAGGPADSSLFELSDGQVRLLEDIPPSGGSLEALTQVWSLCHPAPEDTVVFHGDQAEFAWELAARCGAGLITELSPVMAAHTGSGLLGVAWLESTSKVSQRDGGYPDSDLLDTEHELSSGLVASVAQGTSVNGTVRSSVQVDTPAAAGRAVGARAVGQSG